MSKDLNEPMRSTSPKDDPVEAVRSLITLWMAAAKQAADIAHARRTIFLAYVAEGFTEAQALELSKTI